MERWWTWRWYDPLEKPLPARDAFEEWLPNSGHEPASTAEDVPDLFERYGFGFDAQAGVGDFEVWLAINASGRTRGAPLAGDLA